MTEHLEELFLRHDSTGEDEAELAEEFKAETERLTAGVGEWSRRVGGLPQQRHPGRHIADCDEAITRALRAGETGDYRAAFDALTRARRAAADVQSAWEANLAYESAREALAELEALAPSARLRTLLTFRDLASLLEEALALLGRGKYRQAELLSAACRRRCELLAEPRADAPQSWLDDLERLSACCDEAAPFLPHGREDWADKGALFEVGALVRERGCELAGRLLYDLELELAPHATFLSLFRRLRPAPRPPGADRDLRELIAAESWSAATSYMLRGALEGLGGALAEVPARAAEVQKRLAACRQLSAAG